MNHKQRIRFSQGQRGKFYRRGAELNLPVYLDKEDRKFVEGITDKKKRDMSTVVNDLLKSDMRLAEAIK